MIATVNDLTSPPISQNKNISEIRLLGPRFDTDVDEYAFFVWRSQNSFVARQGQFLAGVQNADCAAQVPPNDSRALCFTEKLNGSHHFHK